MWAAETVTPKKGPVVVDGDVRDTQMMPKLVLSRELSEEAIEVGVTGSKPRPVIAVAEGSNLDHASGRGALWSLCRSESGSGSPRWTSSSRRVSGGSPHPRAAPGARVDGGGGPAR